MSSRSWKGPVRGRADSGAAPDHLLGTGPSPGPSAAPSAPPPAARSTRAMNSIQLLKASARPSAARASPEIDPSAPTAISTDSRPDDFTDPASPLSVVLSSGSPPESAPEFSFVAKYHP